MVHADHRQPARGRHAGAPGGDEGQRGGEQQVRALGLELPTDPAQRPGVEVRAGQHDGGVGAGEPHEGLQVLELRGDRQPGWEAGVVDVLVVEQADAADGEVSVAAPGEVVHQLVRATGMSDHHRAAGAAGKGDPAVPGPRVQQAAVQAGPQRGDGGDDGERVGPQRLAGGLVEHPARDTEQHRVAQQRLGPHPGSPGVPPGDGHQGHPQERQRGEDAELGRGRRGLPPAEQCRQDGESVTEHQQDDEDPARPRLRQGQAAYDVGRRPAWVHPCDRRQVGRTLVNDAHGRPVASLVRPGVACMGLPSRGGPPEAPGQCIQRRERTRRGHAGYWASGGREERVRRRRGASRPRVPGPRRPAARTPRAWPGSTSPGSARWPRRPR